MESLNPVIEPIFEAESKKPVLTEREQQVLDAIMRSNTNREIGVLLNISVKTVEAHRARIFKKFKSKNSVAAAIYAIKNGYYEI